MILKFHENRKSVYISFNLFSTHVSGIIRKITILIGDNATPFKNILPVIDLVGLLKNHGDF